VNKELCAKKERMFLVSCNDYVLEFLLLSEEKLHIFKAAICCQPEVYSALSIHEGRYSTDELFHDTPVASSNKPTLMCKLRASRPIFYYILYYIILYYIMFIPCRQIQVDIHIYI
jgi:hypothetical protein